MRPDEVPPQSSEAPAEALRDTGMGPAGPAWVVHAVLASSAMFVGLALAPLDHTRSSLFVAATLALGVAAGARFTHRVPPRPFVGYVVSGTVVHAIAGVVPVVGWLYLWPTVGLPAAIATGALWRQDRRPRPSLLIAAAATLLLGVWGIWRHMTLQEDAIFWGE